MNKKMTILGFIGIALIAVILTGCGQVELPDPTGPSSGTYKSFSFDYDKDIKTEDFKSVQELSDFIKDNSESSNYYGGMASRTMGALSSEGGPQLDSAPMQESVTKGSVDYSETNVQVKNVDEADIIKTDGEYVYTISNKVLYIIKAYPGEDAEIISTVKFDNRPESIFINGDYLAVFGSFYDGEYFKTLDYVPSNGMTFIDVYDISDKSDPELEKEYKVEGRYFRGRMTGDYMYILTSSRPMLRPDPRPMIMEGNTVTSVAIERIHYYPIDYDNPSFVNINAINLADPSDMETETVVVEGSNELYMSEDNIYVTYTERINEWELQMEIMINLIVPKLSPAEKELVEKIKRTDNDVLSRMEKQQKILQICERYASSLPRDEQDELEDEAELMLKEKLEEFEYFEYTIINKIEVDEEDIDASANGKVPGHVNNQFSMDEDDNVLRIATTINPRWSRFDKERTESMNNVYALDSDLDIIGELEGLAEGERIFSTRFIEDRLYMVTFRQVDPFFVIDLSNPRNIKELGQLKIPGFSRYLHPYDEDVIIGIGQDATETGRTRGLKISLFDVSDVSSPKEIAKYVTEDRYAQSTALYEHKAFLFSKEKNLLVIPAYSYDYQERSSAYNGAFVFDISKEDIELRGLIDHSQGVQSHRPMVERSLYIEELLYTKSPSLLRINSIETLEGVKDIELKEVGGSIPVY